MLFFKAYFNRLNFFCSLLFTICLTDSVAAQDFPSTVGNDTVSWLGSFSIFVHPDFRLMMYDYSGYDITTHRLQSPVLRDSSAIIGRSAQLIHGGTGDLPGVPVGNAGTNVSDLMFLWQPSGFQGPAGRKEIHTEIRELHLTQQIECASEAGGIEIRAGTGLGLPLSPGEMEAYSAGSVFPAEGFFGLRLELELPYGEVFPGAVLYNPFSDPVVLSTKDIDALPPRVNYTSSNTTAVPILFKTDNPGIWNADDVFGYMVFACHASDFTCSEVDLSEFACPSFFEVPLPPPFCRVSFDQLPVGTIFENPDVLPGDELFSENSVPVTIYGYYTSDTMLFLGDVEITPSILNIFGNDQIADFWFSTLEFDFSQLPYPVRYVRFDFATVGEAFNLSVNNGQLFIENHFSDLPDTIAPGIELKYLLDDSFLHIGQAELISFDPDVPIQRFRFGGLSLAMDNICALDGQLATAIEDVHEEEINIFGLHQNQPNPFSGETLITFEMPALWSEPVSLEIYSLQGKLINTLFNGQLPPGKHELSWDGKDSRGNFMPSGIYLYRITSANFSEVKKMSLVK